MNSGYWVISGPVACNRRRQPTYHRGIYIYPSSNQFILSHSVFRTNGNVQRRTEAKRSGDWIETLAIIKRYEIEEGRGCCVEIYKFNNKLVDTLMGNVKQLVALGAHGATKGNDERKQCTVHNINIILKHLTL